MLYKTDKIKSDIPEAIYHMLAEANCKAIGKNANSGSYYTYVTHPDGRTITLRDADHWGYGNWNGRGEIPMPNSQIDLTVGKRQRLTFACKELAKWLGWPHARIDEANFRSVVKKRVCPENY